MKHAIQWHTECIENRRASLRADRERHENQGVILDNRARDLNFSIAQLNLAKEKGKDDYDNERFGFKALLG